MVYVYMLMFIRSIYLFINIYMSSRRIHKNLIKMAIPGFLGDLVS